MNSFPEIGETLGKYKLTSLLGEGATAKVFKASHTYLNTEVAIKILSPKRISEDNTIKERFINEAMNHAKLSHSNLVKIFDIENDKYTYIVMEYVEGKAVDQILNSYGSIPPLKAIRIIKEVCKALKHSFGLNIIHRDIKPANILITRNSEVKLADFGLAKNIDSSADSSSEKGLIYGTPHYMSPEQFINSENVDHRSDIYSLGATLYHIVTGKLPFETNSLEKIITMHLNTNAISPSEISPEITKEFSDFIMKLLEKSPKDRFQNYSEILKILDKLEFSYKSLMFLSQSYEEELSDELSKVRHIEQYQKEFKQYSRSEEKVSESVEINELMVKNKVLGNIKKQINEITPKSDIDKYVSKNIQNYFRNMEHEDDSLAEEKEERLKKKYQKYFKQFQGIELEEAIKANVNNLSDNDSFEKKNNVNLRPTSSVYFKPVTEPPLIIKNEIITKEITENLNKGYQKFNEENKIKVSASKYIEKFKKLFEK